MPLPDLDILVAVAEGGSLTAAAEALDLPRPTLSRRLSRLEEEVGAVLVHRSTRRTVLTEVGEELYRHARPILAAVEAATGAIRARDGVPRGLLRVSVPGVNADFIEIVSSFALACPEVQLEIVAAARHVDLVGEGFDVALRGGRVNDASLIARRIGTNALWAVASPAYLEGHGRPASAAELVEHDCLVHFERGEVPARHWPLLAGGAAEVHPRLASNEPTLLTGAAVAGLGIALVPDLFAAAPVRSGRLEHVLPDEVGATGGMHVVYPERRLLLPRVRAFIDHVVAYFEAHPMTGL